MAAELFDELLGDPGEWNQQRREKHERAVVGSVEGPLVLRNLPLAAATGSSESASLHREVENTVSLHGERARASLTVMDRAV